jgi:hypothetical protein
MRITGFHSLRILLPFTIPTVRPTQSFPLTVIGTSSKIREDDHSWPLTRRGRPTSEPSKSPISSKCTRSRTDVSETGRSQVKSSIISRRCQTRCGSDAFEEAWVSDFRISSQCRDLWPPRGECLMVGSQTVTCRVNGESTQVDRAECSPGAHGGMMDASFAE